MFFKAFKKMIYNVFCKFLFRVEFINSPEDSTYGNFVVCANHSDWMDGVILWSNTPNVRVMAKAELFKIPIWRTIILKAGAFPIKRAEKDFASIYHAVKIVKSDKNNLVIFPEGTRMARQKHVKPKIGAIYISLAGNVPIMPVYIQEKKKIFGKVKVVYGENINYNIEKNEIKDKKLLNRLTMELMEGIYNLGKDI